jgi:drug/metabolite transporter (DMT)-like permease
VRLALSDGAALRLLAVVLLGAVVAPALLISGLARTDAATSALLLALETPFTVLLAGVLFREHVGRRVLAAAALVLGGSGLLGARLPAAGGGAAGAALVAAAALAWALDNVVSRTLADLDALAVVAWKGLAGGLVSGAVAALAGQRFPPAAAAAAILVIGAAGYGLSLQLYLRAQALVGAARTASVFAAAPFAGAVVALATGSPWPGWQLPAAAALILAGVSLHASERHGHRHTHQRLVHEHMHTHDDGHHTHVHHPMPAGPHSHAHEHDAVTHDHEHGDDIHHRHSH